MNQTKIFTKIFESVFNSRSSFDGPSSLPYDKRSSSIPLGEGVVKPLDTGPIAPPLDLGPGPTPISYGSTSRPINKGPTVTASTVRFVRVSIDKETTARPSHEWSHGRQRGSRTPSHKGPTYIPIFRWPTTRQRWDVKSPDIEDKSHVPTATGFNHSSNLENFLWVALGGIVVLVLMAIFMKIGKPIHRVRRQLWSGRPAPIVATRTQDSDDDRYLDMGSLLRLADADLPPPYCACAPEEPPPRFSACFLTDANTKDTEPKVHIQDESIAVNDSEDVDGMRTELVLVNGRIVERPRTDLSSYNKIGVTSSDHLIEQRTKRIDKTDNIKVNIY